MRDRHTTYTLQSQITKTGYWTMKYLSPHYHPRSSLNSRYRGTLKRWKCCEMGERGSLARLSASRSCESTGAMAPQQFIRTGTTLHPTPQGSLTSGSCLFSAPSEDSGMGLDRADTHHPCLNSQSLRIPSAPRAQQRKAQKTYRILLFLIQQSSRFIYKLAGPFAFTHGTMQPYFSYPSFHSPFISSLNLPAPVSVAPVFIYGELGLQAEVKIKFSRVELSTTNSCSKNGRYSRRTTRWSYQPDNGHGPRN